MGILNRIKFFVVIILVIAVSSCTYDHKDDPQPQTGYPPEVENIIINKCATSGCHNHESYQTSARLSLESWDKMFEGSSGGSVVVPFRPDRSTLLFFTNTDTAKGLVLSPQMPLYAPALSASEYETLRNWIEQGAPDVNGNVKFADHPSRQKLYVANQGSNDVAVIDIQSGLIMRYIKVGIQYGDYIHTVMVSPDNQFWFAELSNAGILQRFRTSDNSPAGSITLGQGQWNTMTISKDSKRAYVVELNVPGRIACVDLENMSVINTWNNFLYPHGCTLNKTDDTLYVTAQNGNFIYKIPVNDEANFSQVILDSSPTPSTTPSLNPHDIIFSNDYSKYYITCQLSNEIRVVRTSDDMLLQTIPLPLFPVRMSISKTHPYLFITCMNTVNDSSTSTGRVYVIDTSTDAIITSVKTGHQPHGIAVCDETNLVYVANRNVSHGGPISHHSQPGGRNGYVTTIDMNTLQLTNYNCEVMVDPYSVTISH